MQGLPTATRQALGFEEKILPNGLTVRVKTMPDYAAAHVIYGTRFGSIDQGFVTPEGEKVWLPAGTAHFLEHKMFENDDGVDAFTLYAGTGASANAYTSFDRTCYIFTATEDIEKNLDILLGFVGHPHFTEETVDKEQGIIGQEIGMYKDSADNRLIFSLLAALYEKHPIREEIVGTVESIAEITPEVLYKCTDAFYAPANMVLAAAGNITMEQLLAAIERAGLGEGTATIAERWLPEEPEAVAEREVRFNMPIAMPSFGIGYKQAPIEGSEEEVLRGEVACDILSELICGETSPLYRRLYDEGLVQPGFGGDAGSYSGCLFFFFTGEGQDPERVRALIEEEIERLRAGGIDRAQFATVKRMMYGEAISDLDSVERVASMLAASFFRRRSLEQEIKAIAAVTADEVDAMLQRVLKKENSSFVVVEPLQGA